MGNVLAIKSEPLLAQRHDRMADELDKYVGQLKDMQIRSFQMDLGDQLQGQVDMFQAEALRQREKAKQLRG